MKAIKEGSICKGGVIVASSAEVEKSKAGPKPAGTSGMSAGRVSSNVGDGSGKKVHPRKSDVSGKQKQNGKKTSTLNSESGKRTQHIGSSSGSGKQSEAFPNEVKRVKKNGGDIEERQPQTTSTPAGTGGGKLKNKNQLPNNNKRNKDRPESKITY